ncbi:unnamed protein product [Strongylus vulgaris]|uniref:Uncharacterized protein n=1 Tax=Strongylus vulgaris TaxID=40348 RepID=A0A3P7K7A8_STRVU|nr:unnamed protein product [Strongylus vulgaris]
MERFGAILFVIFLFMEPIATKSLWKRDEKKCKVHRSPPVHHVMDQICLLCHEMFSHEAPNLRAECRANCFRNDRFTSCLAMFSSKNRPEHS